MMHRGVALALCIVVASPARVSALRSPSALLGSRRSFLVTLSGLSLASSARAETAPVLREGDGARCENGSGAACEAAADSELIRELQARSKANREKNERDVRRRWERNAGYEEYFQVLGQKLVEVEDGKYTLVPEAEYAKFVKEQRAAKGAGAPAGQ